LWLVTTKGIVVIFLGLYAEVMDSQKSHIDPNKAVSTPKVQLGEDEPTRVLSTLFGDDTNAIIFNLKYLDEHNPALADRIRKLQEELKDLSSSDEREGPEEDTALAKHMFQKLAWEDMEERTS
jgi:hypothetical protein